jgi:uncharacterized DUF497 family protein
MRFEWSAQKAEANVAKHAVSFRDATTVFADPLALTFDDPDHSAEEMRYLTFGVSDRGRSLVVAHTPRGDNIRIISARGMTPRERRQYEQLNQR